MYTIKEVMTWYGVGYKALRRRFIALGIVSADDAGKGNRERLSYRRLKPFFDEYGKPKNLTLNDNQSSEQLELFQ